MDALCWRHWLTAHVTRNIFTLGSNTRTQTNSAQMRLFKNIFQLSQQPFEPPLSDKDWTPLFLILQHSTTTQASLHLLLPRPQQGKLHPPRGLCLLPRQPPQAPAPLHGPVVPGPRCFSGRRLLKPGDELLPGDVHWEPVRSPRSCCCCCHHHSGWKLGGRPCFLITAVDLSAKNVWCKYYSVLTHMMTLLLEGGDVSFLYGFEIILNWKVIIMGEKWLSYFYTVQWRCFMSWLFLVSGHCDIP